MSTSKRYSPEVRERAVRLLFEHEAEYDSQWAAIGSIVAKMGCTAETLRKRVREAERDQGRRAGVTSTERGRLKELEREKRELKRANEFCARRRLFSASRSSTSDRSDGVIYGCRSCRVRGRVNLRAIADCPIAILRAQSA